MTVGLPTVAAGCVATPQTNPGLHVEQLPRKLEGPACSITHPLATGRYQSPLRYPGAKSGLAAVIGSLLGSAKSSRQVGGVDLLVEPFAGGASTSLRLVGAGIVDRVLLADADPMVASFWQVAASKTDELIDRMTDEHARFVAPGGSTALDRWDFWKAWKPPLRTNVEAIRSDLAMKCLFLNRTTFSGILHGQAGPIGGRRQESDFSIGCRFNIEALAKRLRYVGHLYETGRLIDVWCKGWRATLTDVAEWYPQLLPNRVVAYLDPPTSRSQESSTLAPSTIALASWMRRRTCTGRAGARIKSSPCTCGVRSDSAGCFRTTRIRTCCRILPSTPLSG